MPAVAFVAERDHPDKVGRITKASGREAIDFTTGGRITFHATEPPLGVDLPTPPAVVMDGQDPLIGDDT